MPKESEVVLPLDGTVVGYSPKYKRFGEYFEDRFRGYHTGEDAEVPPKDLGPGEVQLVPVLAVADGSVVFRDDISGYGGVIVLRHTLNGETIQSLYGHLDLDSASVRVGDTVRRGEFLVNLGADKSPDTDGEREHLHFAVWRGTDLKLSGYVKNAADLDQWINPHDFFTEYGAALPQYQYSAGWFPSHNLYYPEPPRIDTGLSRRSFGDITFDIPADWDVEFIPSLDALNLYQVSGPGAARERSQILIRYFDAADFLTLKTVDVLSTEPLTVGKGDYVARRYIIFKKAEVPDFKDQPSWRNQKHTVTDFRTKDGFSRFYVVAANPLLDSRRYEQILASMEIAR